MSDLKTLSRALADVETRAGDLPWAKERRWRTKTHLRTEHDLPVVDLHDLSVRLAVDAVEAAIAVAGALDAPGIVWITGRGRHSVTGKSSVRAAVYEALAGAVGQRGWRLRPQGPGRLVLVLDAKRMPGAGPGIGLVLIGLLLLAALLLALYATLAG